ncbi:MAG: ferritin-like domain-containing protein [Verrucomicrobiota bacterium]
MSKLNDIFIDELKDLYDAEHQLTKGLPKMAKAAKHPELKAAFAEHLEQTHTHIQRLEEVFEIFGETPKRKTCKAMKGLLEEGKDLIEDKAGDAALIAGAQKVEHYEIASYGTLATWAMLLNQEDAKDLLGQTLDEEKETDERLTEIAESAANPDENEEAGEDEEKPKSAGKKPARKE